MQGDLVLVLILVSWTDVNGFYPTSRAQLDPTEEQDYPKFPTLEDKPHLQKQKSTAKLAEEDRNNRNKKETCCSACCAKHVTGNGFRT